MPKLVFALAALAFVVPSVPAIAGAGNFTVVNGSGVDIASMAIRRFGTNDWRPLSAAPAKDARSVVQFSDVDCAFDLRATLAGGATAMWDGVNLCEANVVTLRRRPTGETWVDYD